MLATKRFSAVTTALLAITALAALAIHSTAKGAPPVVVNRPISYLTSGGSGFNIEVIDEKGSSSITVNRGTSGTHPRWSPDGLLIGGYYKWLGTDNAIMAMSPSGANERAVLTQGGFLAWNLSRVGTQDYTRFGFFSSNCWLGRDAIIFAGNNADTVGAFRRQHLFIVDRGVIQPLTESAPDATYDFDPHWSETLKKVVYVGGKGEGIGSPELYTINRDGTGAQKLTTFGSSVTYLHRPVWSPSGDRIVVGVQPNSGNTWQLWILHVDLSLPNPVTAMVPFKVVDGGGGYVQTPAWSPDGHRIVFSRTVYDRNNRRIFELVIANAASGVETVIKRSSSNIEMPDWNPVP